MTTRDYQWPHILAKCGGNANLGECAQYPNLLWLKAHSAGELLGYWPWVCKSAQLDGLALEDLTESEASFTRRTRQLPGAHLVH